MKHTIIYHSIVLIICSDIGFIDHYFQFGIIRVTSWIPASVGNLLIIIGFGILVTNMFFTFLFQDFQPLRKKLVFSVISISSIISLIILLIKFKIPFSKKHYI